MEAGPPKGHSRALCFTKWLTWEPGASCNVSKTRSFEVKA